MAASTGIGPSLFNIKPLFTLGSRCCTPCILDAFPSFPSSQILSRCLSIGQVPDWGQQVVDQLLPGSGAQHALKDTDGLAALGMGREPEAGVGTGSCEKTHSGLADSLGCWALSPWSPDLV